MYYTTKSEILILTLQPESDLTNNKKEHRSRKWFVEMCLTVLQTIHM